MLVRGALVSTRCRPWHRQLPMRCVQRWGSGSASCRSHLRSSAAEALGDSPPVELNASDVATLVGSEEGDHFGNFVQGSCAAEGYFPCDAVCVLFDLFLRHAQGIAVARRRNHARTNSVDADFRSLRSVVKVRAKDRTAALDALYTLNAGGPVTETIDAFRMIELPSFRSGSAFCTVNRRPLTLTLNVLSKCSSVIAPSGANSPVPALAKRMSMWPFCCFTVAYNRSRSARFETSPCTAVTLLPICFTAALSSL